MILVEYYRMPNLSYVETVEKMYVDISHIQYITYALYDCSNNIVIGINGESFMLTKDSGNEILSWMGLSKEDLMS